MSMGKNAVLKKKGTSLKIDSNILRLLAIFIAFILIASATKPNFSSLSNFQSITKQMVEFGLMSMGVGVCMISGGIDLSVVYIANLCGISAALFLKSTVKAGMPAGQETAYLILAVLIAVLIGSLCGALNGILVSYLKIPAMLATLGTYQLFYGISIVVSKGSSVSGIPGSFSRIGNMQVLGTFPLTFFIFLIVAIIVCIIMEKSAFGTRVYLVGTNMKAANFAGVRTKNILVRTYMLSGIIASLAGLASLSRINSAKADFGSSYTMQCILIAVLGGINPNGGFGSMIGVTIAVFILQVLSSYLNMFPNISNFFRDLIWGVALIAVLIMNFMIDKRKIARQNKSA